MALFSNPMDAAWSRNQKFCFLLYSIFMAASVWASGQSFVRTLEASGLLKVLCYVVAFAELATASFCLGLVKVSVSRGYVSGRSIKLLSGGIGFIFLWFSILMANTNNIYYVMTINNQRQKELRNIKNQLELVGSKSVSAFKAAKEKFRAIIEGDIRNMKDEIQNPNNPGSGEKTGEIVNRIGEKLKQNIDRPTNPPSLRDFNGRRQYADSMADKIRDITREKLLTIDDKIQQLNAFLQKEDYQNTQKTVDDLIDSYAITSERDITQGLRNSYSTYKKAQEYIDQLYSEPLIKENTNLLVTVLPEIPVSIESEDIAYSWGEFFKNGNVSRARFLWAMLIGLILDVACFLFWYFGVLPEEN